MRLLRTVYGTADLRREAVEDPVGPRFDEALVAQADHMEIWTTGPRPEGRAFRCYLFTGRVEIGRRDLGDVY